MNEPIAAPNPAALVFARRRDISFQDFGGEGLLVVPRQSLQIVLNATSLRLLQLVDGRRTVADIAAAFAEEYDAPAAETLHADLLAALAELEQHGAIERLPHA
jgi:hypothetical protein